MTDPARPGICISLISIQMSLQIFPSVYILFKINICGIKVVAVAYMLEQHGILSRMLSKVNMITAAILISPFYDCKYLLLGHPALKASC